MSKPVVFVTKQKDLVKYNGLSCKAIVPLKESKYDENAVGPTYRIVLETGTQLNCYADELYVKWEE